MTLLITDIYFFYPESSTHATQMVLGEVLHPIQLEFWGEGKTGEPREKPLGTV